MIISHCSFLQLLHLSQFPLFTFSVSLHILYLSVLCISLHLWFLSPYFSPYSTSLSIFYTSLYILYLSLFSISISIFYISLSIFCMCLHILYFSPYSVSLLIICLFVFCISPFLSSQGCTHSDINIDIPRYGARCLSLSKIVPDICKLLEDPSPQVCVACLSLFLVFALLLHLFITLLIVFS